MNCFTDNSIDVRQRYDTNLTTSPLSASLNPDVILEEIDAGPDENAEAIRTSLEELLNNLENPDDARLTEYK